MKKKSRFCVFCSMSPSTHFSIELSLFGVTTFRSCIFSTKPETIAQSSTKFLTANNKEAFAYRHLMYGTFFFTFYHIVCIRCAAGLGSVRRSLAIFIFWEKITKKNIQHSSASIKTSHFLFET